MAAFPGVTEALIANFTDLSTLLNGTGVDGPKLTPTGISTAMLKQIHDVLIVVLLVSTMFAMGCSITWFQVLKK